MEPVIGAEDRVFANIKVTPGYNYNVILAKKSVLRDYYAWLFPILIRTEELTDGENRSERYIGYMAETLETLYFIRNSERFGGKLNVVHTLCKLYL